MSLFKIIFCSFKMSHIKNKIYNYRILKYKKLLSSSRIFTLHILILIYRVY